MSKLKATAGRGGADRECAIFGRKNGWFSCHAWIGRMRDSYNFVDAKGDSYEGVEPGLGLLLRSGMT